MNNQNHILVTANEAVAKMAYKTNEVCVIYPITPASQMSELTEQWSAKQLKNIFGGVPICQQMQSEAGVAGAMHGALQTGSLSTTFTASQGLLLMLPNMYKIAGELTPNVIHVATRTIATHALSVFGDHSDVMAVRSSGYAMMASSSVQEAMDFALISQIASLKSRIPFLHFFDGFRTSHEIQKIVNVDDQIIERLMDFRLIDGHRQRALNPNAPVIRGTTQGPDTFFQSREAVNSYYNDCPGIVQGVLDTFGNLTGRNYRIFEYYGHPEAEEVLVSMASSTETIASTVDHLNNNGGKVGLIRVRLYRPFSKKHLLYALPSTCKKIAVLDRTKEPGTIGEPLFQDVASALVNAFQNNEISFLPRFFAGRYGLSSKEFTPSMVVSIFNNLSSSSPKTKFTVGIEDNMTYVSLPKTKEEMPKKFHFQGLFYGFKEASFTRDYPKFLGELGRDSAYFLQSYTEIDYRKSNSRNVQNLRVDDQPINAPYLIQKANMAYCDSTYFLLYDNVLDRLTNNATLIVRSEDGAHDFWHTLTTSIQRKIRSKSLNVYLIKSASGVLFEQIKKISYDRNHQIFGCVKVDTSLDMDQAPQEGNDEFNNTFLGQLVASKGDKILVGDFPVDGSYPLGTSQYIQNRNKGVIPTWDMDACTQCGRCSVACPQAAIRVKVYEDTYLPNSKTFKSVKAAGLGDSLDLLNYTIQIHPDQCTSCNLCVDACESSALKMTHSKSTIANERKNWAYFENIPEFDRTRINVEELPQQQVQEPLFKYSLGEDGCSQGPYLKMISQLFGDRMLVANATGASSIFGGALPTTPWSSNSEGRGPAWSNSLFEDNAEFGLGFQLTQKAHSAEAHRLLFALEGKIDSDLIREILNNPQKGDACIQKQRTLVKRLKIALAQVEDKDAMQLRSIVDSLVKKSIWIVGGDGWAYDIGFGGLDHVLASGENVNVLVLDNELYSNTGGQQSKATPKGATANFVHNGKLTKKKDLGIMAMHYDNVYVASVAIGADPHHALRTLVEAESYDGPSLVIAYCPSNEHGAFSRNPMALQKAAVASGHWTLYRNDPRRLKLGLPKFQLDSERPTDKIEAYFELEGRFSKTLQHHPERLSDIQREINRRHNYLLSLSKTGQGLNYESLKYMQNETY